jgi:hypothetical protein
MGSTRSVTSAPVPKTVQADGRVRGRARYEREASTVDARVAELPLDRMAPLDPDSPISPARSEHRGEHLDELEQALRDRG